MDHANHHKGPVCSIYPLDETGVINTGLDDLEDLGFTVCTRDGTQYGIAPCDPLVFSDDPNMFNHGVESTGRLLSALKDLEI